MPGDEAGVLACLAEAFEPYRTRYTPAGFADTVLDPATLARRMETMTIFVAASRQSEIVGTIACGISAHAKTKHQLPNAKYPGSEGHLRGMAVRNGWQGSGLAGRLLERAEAELVAHGCSRITLDTTLPLERAMRFYEKHGYCRSGRQQDFFGMLLLEYVKETGD